VRARLARDINDVVEAARSGLGAEDGAHFTCIGLKYEEMDTREDYMRKARI